MFNKLYVQKAINELTRTVGQPRDFYRVLNKLKANEYLHNKYNDYYYLILEKISENLIETAQNKSLNLIKSGKGYDGSGYNGFFNRPILKNIDVEDSEILADYGLKILKHKRHFIIKHELLYYNMKQNSFCNYVRNLGKIIMLPTDKVRYLDLLNFYIKKITDFEMNNPNNGVKTSMRKKICTNLRRIKYQYLLNDAITNDEYYSALLNFKKLQNLAVNETGFDAFKFETGNYIKLLSLCIINQDKSIFDILLLDLYNQISDQEFRDLFMQALKFKNYIAADLLFQTDLLVNVRKNKKSILNEVFTKDSISNYLKVTDNHVCFLALMERLIEINGISENEAIYMIYKRSFNKMRLSAFDSIYCVNLFDKLSNYNLDKSIYSDIVDLIIHKNESQQNDSHLKMKRDLIREVRNDRKIDDQSKVIIYSRIAESIANHKYPKIFFKVKALHHLMSSLKDEPNRSALGKKILFEGSILVRIFKRLNMEESEKFFHYRFFQNIICSFFGHSTEIMNNPFEKLGNRLISRTNFDMRKSKISKIADCFPEILIIQLENIILQNAVINDDILFLDYYIAIKAYNITDTKIIKDIIQKILEQYVKYGKFEKLYYRKLLRYLSIIEKSKDFGRLKLLKDIENDMDEKSGLSKRFTVITEFEKILFSSFNLLVSYQEELEMKQNDDGLRVSQLEEDNDMLDNCMSEQDLEESVFSEQRIETINMSDDENEEISTSNKEEENMVIQDFPVLEDKKV